MKNIQSTQFATGILRQNLKIALFQRQIKSYVCWWWRQNQQLDKIICSLVAFIWISTANYFLLALYDCVFPWIECSSRTSVLFMREFTVWPSDRAFVYKRRKNIDSGLVFIWFCCRFFFQTNSIYKIIHRDRETWLYARSLLLKYSFD